MAEQSREQLLTLIDQQRQEIEALKHRIICSSRDQKALKVYGKTRVAELLGGKESEIYRDLYRSTIASLWSGFRRKFEVKSYRDTLEMNLSRSFEWIDEWHPEWFEPIEPALPAPTPPTCLLCESRPSTITTDSGERICGECADIMG